MDVIDRPESSSGIKQSPMDVIDRPESSSGIKQSPIAVIDRPESSIRRDLESNPHTASQNEVPPQPHHPTDIEGEAAPEKKIILWTIMIAAVEKIASALGTMNFIWATVVLLGGFALTLKSIDFWFVSIILTAEGLRILGRRGELETEAASCWRIAPNLDGLITWLTFYSATMQEFSSVTSGSLSAIRLWRRNYGGNDNGNRNAALIIFYVLSLVEALMILFGFAFKIDLGLWPFWRTNPGRLGRFVLMGMIRPGRLVMKVTKDYGFDDSQHSIVRRFFYETFSRCVNGSLFEGFKMDFVSYTVNLVQSTNRDEQLTGAQVLSLLLESNKFALKTLRTISTKQGVAEMLIEMLTWKSPHEKEIRMAAAKIVSNLVQREPNGIWVRAVTRSMDSVASLLYDSNKIEKHSRRYGDQPLAYNYSFFSSLGLRILKILAKDHVNCTMIGRNRGLLRKVIAITELILDPLDWQISGDLKILAIDTLTSLAHEQKELLESIGAKSVVVHNLLSLFLTERINSTEELSAKAGEALSVLSLENKQNCEIIMSIKLGNDPNMIASLISMLNINPVKFLHVARILRNLLVYANAELVKLTEITATAPQVVEFVMTTRDAHQEAAIGLAVQIFKVMTVSDFYRVFEEQGREINRSLTKELLNVLREHTRPSKKVPGIRRFSVELLILLAKMDRSERGMRSDEEEALEKISQKISKSRSFSAFGLSTGALNVSDLLVDIGLSGKGKAHMLGIF